MSTTVRGNLCGDVIHFMQVTATDKRLGARDRELFAALADVVYGNPFSARRTALIVRLTGDPASADLWMDPEALARIVGPRLASWRSGDARAGLTGE